MKQIRWGGLIAFVTLVGGALLFWFVFADQLAKRAVETIGAQIMGAKVELDNADVTLIPAGLTLTRLQVTDPDSSMRNVVEMARIELKIDAGQLFWRKLVVETMSMEGLRFNTPRKQSGALDRRPIFDSRDQKQPAEESDFEFPSLTIPDLETILQSESLESVAAVENARAEFDGKRRAWDQRLADLPDRQALDAYRERLKSIRAGAKGGVQGFLGGATDLIAVRNELKADLDRISRARVVLREDLAGLKQRLDEVARMPASDFKRLKEKYSLTESGLTNLGRLLIGPMFGQWTDTAFLWYGRLKPILDRIPEKRKNVEVTKPLRAKGLDVRFKETYPVPSFWVKTAQASLTIPAGAFSARLSDASSDQRIVGRPATIQVEGKELKNLKLVAVNGEFNRLDPARSRDAATIRLRGATLPKRPLSKSDTFPVELSTADMDLDLSVELLGERLSGSGSARLANVAISSSPPEKAGLAARAAAEALGRVKTFRVEMELDGAPSNYDINLTSDLDRVLKDAVQQQIRKEADLFEQRLGVAIAERVDKDLDQLRENLNGFDGLIGELAARTELGDALLKQAVSAAGPKLPF